VGWAVLGEAQVLCAGVFAAGQAGDALRPVRGHRERHPQSAAGGGRLRQVTGQAERARQDAAHAGVVAGRALLDVDVWIGTVHELLLPARSSGRPST
jgi:hypothetical protein